MRIKNQNGFTLVELILVTLLFSAMAVMLLTSLNSLIAGKKSIEKQRVADQIARYVFTRITKELSGFALIPLSNIDKEGKSTGNTSRYFSGTNDRERGQNKDSITFATITAGQVVQGDAGNRGAIEVEYRLEDDPEKKNEGSIKNGRSYLLIRRELPAGLTNKKNSFKQQVEFPVANNLAGINFRYLRDENWVDTWEDDSISFPKAIEITLEVLGEDKQKVIFRTAIPLIQRQSNNSF
jgi:prepilin-type N-terminal cleavage/methylation domain-containing protein